MPRVALVPFVPPKEDRGTPLGVGESDTTLVASDPINFHSVKHTGREVIIAQGVGTVTIHSAPDALGRLGDVMTYAVSAAPKVTVMGPFPVVGWRQPDGTLSIDTSAATVLLAVVQLPSIL